MGTRDGKGRFLLLVLGVLGMAWALAFLANFGAYHAWLPVPAGGSPSENAARLVAATLAFAAVVIAWLFYTLGMEEIRKQARMERQFRYALEEAYRGTLHALTSALDLRDDETYGHSRRVMGYSLALGVRMGLDHREMQTLAWGALLHDLGKIAIRDDILLKPGPLTRDERAQMNQHVVIGHQMVQNVPVLARAGVVVRHHHERYDGTGYPDRLQGDQIPLLARIFSVADAFDAMTSPRPYRPVPMSLERARQVIREQAGHQFCPSVVRAFMQIPLPELEEIRVNSYMPMEDLGALVQLDEDIGSLLPQYYRDSLTGAQNREGWEAKKAQMTMTRGMALGTVLFLDMDGLKQLNDTYGHMAGDRVLADLGARLLQVSREVYRVGGDEFVLWFPVGTWTPAAEQKLLDALQYFTDYWSDLLPGISVSWGISTATEETPNLETLLHEADKAMYAHKAQQRDAG